MNPRVDLNLVSRVGFNRRALSSRKFFEMLISGVSRLTQHLHLTYHKESPVYTSERLLFFLGRAQSTEDALNEELLREAEAVTEFLYGTRSRVAARNLLATRLESQEHRFGNNSSGYDVYFISSKQQQSSTMASQPQQQAPQQPQQSNRRPKTLQRGATMPNANQTSTNYDFNNPSPDVQARCNSSTCNYWPHCLQRDNVIYSPNQQNQTSIPVLMKLSQSYPANHRVPPEPTTSNQICCDSACSSPGSVERPDDRDYRQDNNRKNKYQDRLPKGVLKVN